MLLELRFDRNPYPLSRGGRLNRIEMLQGAISTKITTAGCQAKSGVEAFRSAKLKSNLSPEQMDVHHAREEPTEIARQYRRSGLDPMRNSSDRPRTVSRICPIDRIQPGSSSSLNAKCSSASSKARRKTRLERGYRTSVAAARPDQAVIFFAFGPDQRRRPGRESSDRRA